MFAYVITFYVKCPCNNVLSQCQFNQLINIVRPKVDQRAGQLSLQHIGVTKTDNILAAECSFCRRTVHCHCRRCLPSRISSRAAAALRRARYWLLSFARWRHFIFRNWPQIISYTCIYREISL